MGARLLGALLLPAILLLIPSPSIAEDVRRPRPATPPHLLSGKSVPDSMPTREVLPHCHLAGAMLTEDASLTHEAPCWHAEQVVWSAPFHLAIDLLFRFAISGL